MAAASLLSMRVPLAKLPLTDKLLHILSSNENHDIVSWSTDGQSFYVFDHARYDGARPFKHQSLACHLHVSQGSPLCLAAHLPASLCPPRPQVRVGGPGDVWQDDQLLVLRALTELLRCVAALVGAFSAGFLTISREIPPFGFGKTKVTRVSGHTRRRWRRRRVRAAHPPAHTCAVSMWSRLSQDHARPGSWQDVLRVPAPTVFARRPCASDANRAPWHQPSVSIRRGGRAVGTELPRRRRQASTTGAGAGTAGGAGVDDPLQRAQLPTDSGG
jgi:hypothetical protein